MVSWRSRRVKAYQIFQGGELWLVEGKQVLVEEQIGFRPYADAGRNVVRLRYLEEFLLDAKSEVVEMSKISFGREIQNQLKH